MRTKTRNRKRSRSNSSKKRKPWFKRTNEEIKLGLTVDQARKRRKR